MVNFNQIDKARKILKLNEDASFKDIIKSYRTLALKYHPDKCKEKKKKSCEEMFKKITQANDLLMSYCEEYKFSFKERNVKENSVDQESLEHLKRFYDGWWSDLNL
jgi:curved DNA-binding protein CbpA